MSNITNQCFYQTLVTQVNRYFKTGPNLNETWYFFDIITVFTLSLGCY